jgi:hypothetical protein
MSVGKTFHHFIDVTLDIRLKVPNLGKKIQRLVTYANFVDSNLQQVKSRLGIPSTKNGDKKKPSYMSRWSNQESKVIFHEFC